jgi:hypothetical protein
VEFPTSPATLRHSRPQYDAELKDESLFLMPADLARARVPVDHAVHLYNGEQPHLALHFLSTVSTVKEPFLLSSLLSSNDKACSLELIAEG